MSDYAVLAAPSQGNSQTVAMTTASAQSTAFLDNSDLVVTVTALCFVLRGINPTATSDGKCLALAPNIPYRLRGVQQGEKLAFIVPTGTGSAYITPGS